MPARPKEMVQSGQGNTTAVRHLLKQWYEMRCKAIIIFSYLSDIAWQRHSGSGPAGLSFSLVQLTLPSARIGPHLSCSRVIYQLPIATVST